MKRSSENYIFSYQGEHHLIDLETLLVTQMNFSGAINEITRKLYPDLKVQLKISTISPGSFELHQVFEYSFFEHIFTKENFGLLADIFGVIGGFGGIYAFLKGRKAKAVNNKGMTTTIELDGQTLEVDSRIWELYTTNQIVSDCLRRAFSKVENDENIDGLKVSEEGKTQPILEVPQADFPLYTLPNPYFDAETREVLHERVMLRVKKIDFRPTGNSKSSFYFEGRKIDAVIKDVHFLSRLEKGLKLGLGDGLVVDMVIHQKYNVTFQTFLEANKNEILKVHDIDARPYDEQGSLSL